LVVAVLALALLGFRSAHADAQSQISIQSWTSACKVASVDKSLDCGLPQKISSGIFSHPLPKSKLAPGEVSVHKLSQSFEYQELDLKYELRIFEVYPKVGIRYYQVQLEWIAPARATCMLSVDASRKQWSPMTCVATDDRFNRWGLNLSVGH
jgi:hypothetical protein